MKEFFDAIRAAFGSLSQSQVDGINALLKATASLSLTHRAYILATAWHETARTMQPIAEFGKREYFNKYEPGTSIGKALGNTVIGDGYRYRGRGYVQITGRANYQKASLATGRNLISEPDLALDPDIAADIIVRGMTQGWFTGKKLSDYSDYVQMRRIVNGTDRAELIASYARTFEQALKAIKASEPPILDINPEQQEKTMLTVIMPFLMPILRHALTTLAGVLATYGVIQAGQQEAFIAIVLAVVSWALGQGLSLINAVKK